MNTDILIGGANGHSVHLNPKFANRHGLIAGATGTGKTVTLQVLAEQFSAMGVPVFMADNKGDLSGISQAGSAHPKIDERVQSIGIEGFDFSASPTVCWDIFGRQGHPVRATISDLGPTLLSRLLDLNDTQEGVLNVCFEFADDEGLLLLDFKDLRTTLKFVGDNAKSFRNEYGNISSASVGAIQRRLLVLENEGAEHFFGEPSLDLWDFMRPAPDGRGYIHLLAANELMQTPRLYATFLLWLLSELFENLPEVGDQEKPRLVFFFDEAHLLFDDAPKALVEKVEMVVRLIRSKGVGVFFVTQSPLDIPDSVLGQLGNRVQHALRAFTPRDQKTVKAVAQTMRANPDFDTEKLITQLGVGEALVSTLDDDGIPSITQKTLISPPRSRMGPMLESERYAVKNTSPFSGRYDHPIDRDSAHERLQQRVQDMTEAAEQEPTPSGGARRMGSTPARKPKGRKRQSVAETLLKSVARSVGSSLGRQIARGLLGSIFRGR